MKRKAGIDRKQVANTEISQLREMKNKLLKQAIELKEQLKAQEANGHQSSNNNFNIKLPSNEYHKSTKSMCNKYKIKLSEISNQITGIAFENVNKKRLRQDVYLYTAKVVTKAVCFNLELTVVLKKFDSFTIDDITAHFVDIEKGYMLEISPWFQKIAKTKNFSCLMSALSDYNEKTILRSEILNKLESKKYATTEQNKENGGVLVYMHSPADTKKHYVTFHWTLKFVKLTWHIEHFFTIISSNIGIEFSKENNLLLKDFCKVDLTKDNLLELWYNLCTAIDAYHGK
ncbi:uncharacterized protein LOC109852617 [Pseudomyrmex gracilis]|uniref:uncharacterized protein LOC109852617 n=1 Tax=Pseudomyrmex gracilis TaxID=219809 RepID=UPI00099549DF|nr:uncharacterized protein LOC109852617 [Pseudomyrmex gracilis]XP_020279510.1 uncharacterized protein LOC109852617 [Pseudomyrmex gracilis]